jgi:hypothetical protein
LLFASKPDARSASILTQQHPFCHACEPQLIWQQLAVAELAEAD